MTVNYLEIIDDMRFPATRAELIDHAAEKNASEEVLDLFQAMPDQQFYNIEDVSRNMLEIREVPGTRTNLFSSSQSE